MAITAYVGKPRSGKSYSVVCHVILPSLKLGRSIATNIPIHVDKLPKDQQSLIIPIDLQKFADDKEYFDDIVAKSSIFVLDELWRFFPAGVTTNNIPFHHKQFLAEHGHMVDETGRSKDIVFVTQDLSQISKFPRDLVEKTYRTVKLVDLGTRSKFRVDMYTGSVSGENPPISKLSSKSHLQSYDPKIYQFYKSHTLSEGDGATEVNVDARGGIFNSLRFKVFIPLALIIGTYSVWHLYNFFHPEPVQSIEEKKEAKKATTTIESKQPSKPVEQPKAFASDMSITGTMSFTVNNVTTTYVNIQKTGGRNFRIDALQYCKYGVPGIKETLECKINNQYIVFKQESQQFLENPVETISKLDQ